MRREPTNRWASRPTTSRSAHAGRGSGAWRRVSRETRANHPFCQVCAVRPSTEVHHLVPWKESETHRLDARNLVAVCRDCHEQLER